KRSFFRRVWAGIDAHPVPTLLLAMAAVTTFFWNRVDTATVAATNAVNLAISTMSDATVRLNTATNRVDGLFERFGVATADIKNMSEQIKGVSETQSAMAASFPTIEQGLSLLNAQFKSIRPMEIRLIE